MFIIPEFNASQGSVVTYRGTIQCLNDALLVLEGTRVGILPKVKRRLNGLERKYIAANTVFAWNETECGMKRWTDGKNWSASKVSGPFLTYRELDSEKSLKTNGLIKQSFSLITKQNQKIHLISYLSSDSEQGSSGKIPSLDPKLNELSLNSNIYQESLLSSEQDRQHKRLLVSSEPTSRSNSVEDISESYTRPSSVSPRINNMVQSPKAADVSGGLPQFRHRSLPTEEPRSFESSKRVKLMPPIPVPSSPYQIQQTQIQTPSYYYSNVSSLPSPTFGQASVPTYQPYHYQHQHHRPQPQTIATRYTNNYNANDIHALNVLDRVFSVQ